MILVSFRICLFLLQQYALQYVHQQMRTTLTGSTKPLVNVTLLKPIITQPLYFFFEPSCIVLVFLQ